MSAKEIQYKRTLRGSVGAGVGALFNGKGRRYFILEHKDASKYHKAGDSQKIIIDQIELGRDGSCQVRFDDESFPTVSRKHAAIVKDGDRWKIVQLSKTNSTFLNGKSITDEWFLENGDEIQLSVGGPRLGFIIPEGKQSLVSSIRMTERLNLFRKQALRPYKAAIACLALLILLVGAASAYVIHGQGQEIAKLWKDKFQKEQLIAQLDRDIRADSIRLDSLSKVKQKTVTQYIGGGGATPAADITEQINKVKTSVYALVTSVYVDIDGESKKIGSPIIGTGFLTTDGRFITARHCVEPWMFDTSALQQFYALSRAIDGIKIYAEVTAINSKNEAFTLKSTNFQINRSYDSPYEMTLEYDGEQYSLTGALAFGTKASLGNDWAVARIGKKGSIEDGRSFSANLKAGTTAHVLGFPQACGIADGKKFVEPIYNTLSVSRDGLNDGRCIMVNQGIDHGNSGGPVFIQKNGKLYVIGIVSRGDIKSNLYNHLIPMSNLQ